VRRLLTILAGIGVASFALATPAFAGNTPPDCTTAPGCKINATVTVQASMSLSGIADFSFGSTAAGTTVTGHESYVVTTNNPTGYTLALQGDGGSTGACNGNRPCFIAPNPNGPAFQFPDQGNVTVTETGTAPQVISTWVNSSNSGPQVNIVNHTNGPTPGAGDAYSETYSLTVPSGAAPATYDSDYFYMATPNA
jgi:hypothetical protein